MQALGLGEKFRESLTRLEMGVPLVGDELRVVAEDVPAAIAKFGRAEFLELMEGADVAAVAVLRPGEGFDDPQVEFNQLIVEVDDPDLGRLQQVGPPIRLSATPAGVRGAAPAVGAHTETLRRQAAAVSRRQTATAPHPTHVLAGLKVIDLGQYFAGPFGPRMLSDLGAEVIKVESPAGDPMRPLLSVFEAAQRGKRSLAIDLKTDYGRAVVHRLVAGADVVAHNFRPGVAERLGVGPADLRPGNPALVYCANHGWGSTGPKAHLQSFAPLLQGFSGLSVMAAGEGNPPVTIGPNEDYYNAMLGAIGILMALVSRRQTGVGQVVESPQVNSCLFAVTHVMRDATGSIVPTPSLAGDRRGFDAFTRIYPTAAGWLGVACQTEAQRAALVGAVGVPAADDDNAGLILALERRLRARPATEWFAQLTAAGVACEVAADRSYLTGQLWEDRRHRGLGRVVTQQHPEGGTISEIATLIHYSRSAIPPRGPAPTLGEHSEVILSELGMSAPVP